MAVIAMPALTLTLGAHPSWHWHRQPPPCAPRLRCHTGLLSPSSFPRTLAPSSHAHASELARGLVARAAIESTAQESGPSDGGAILLVGVTGGTGGSVVNGLLASGVDGSKLRVLTRSPDGAAARNLAASGVQAIAGDLDDPKRISEILKGVKAIYCHATSKDAAKADPAGDVRAETLAKAAASAGVEHIVYNSTGGGGHGISQVEQKHNIENIFKSSGIPTTNLRATMFMEEFWKVYTRPQILKGSFPFSMPSDKPLQLVAVKDMGLSAGIALKKPEEYGGVSLELAGDELTPAQMCEAYAKAQGSNVNHFSPPKFLFWFLNRDLYRISKFLSEKGYEADVADCRKRFPGLLTFSEFLELTHWGDASRNYADGFKY
ncbi:hypothetical protein M758_1G060800 [Ceratodon purpureus]|nr:hypothetical protein M758_1G060800 [Ceratodon purpureus]